MTKIQNSYYSDRLGDSDFSIIVKKDQFDARSSKKSEIVDYRDSPVSAVSISAVPDLVRFTNRAK